MRYTKHSILSFFLFILGFSNYVFAQTPPTITAEGDQYYCPLSEINIATDFNIIDVDDNVEAVYIQISIGYVNGEDKLTLNGSHPNITLTPFNTSEGKLILTRNTSATIEDLANAVKDVVFESSSPTPSGEKHFSFTVSEANYLPSTGHYYEYIEDIGITWTDAKVAAETRNYYGLQGYLATITSPEEAQLSGEQAGGAGWIGGSDAETEETWKWVTGPEAGTVFWNGGINGSSPNYANWNANEPNQAGNEDYAHVTAPGVGNPGSWNDLSNIGNDFGDYQPKGYIVEYGGMPGDPTLDLSASTKITIPSINSINENTRCGIGTVTLSATATAGNVLWFDSETSTTPIHTGTSYTIPSLTTTTTYYVLASENGCTNGERKPVTATVNPLPDIEASLTFKNCDEDGNPDGFTDFNLNEVIPVITKNDASLNVTFYLSESDANSTTASPINPVPFNNNTASTVYARVENSFGCYLVSTVDLEVSTTSLPSDFMEELTECDDDEVIDGFHSFDLTEATTVILSQLSSPESLTVHYFNTIVDAQLEQNEILPQNNYVNQTKDTEVLIVRVESETNGNCYEIGEYLTLTVNPIPEFEVDPTAMVCLNLSPITIETKNPKGDYSYEWFNENAEGISNQSTAEISKGGTYTVIAISNLYNCESVPQTVTVTESDIPHITLNDITVVDDSENNSITINTANLGVGDYEFSLDDEFGIYQNEPFFEMVSPGIHTIYINDKNNCGTAQIEVSVMGFPKFFTPNNDGYNDTWTVQGLDTNFYISSLMYIFDRFGKILAVIDTAKQGWEGFFNGERLPASDYWYVVQLTDINGNIREKKGHFSLIR